MKANKIEELIGNTPIVKLNKLVSEDMADVYVKLENFNLTGSVKIRAAYQMVKDALESGLIKEGDILVEPTSGNTGIALAYIANLLGLNMVLVMPETMSLERRQIMEAYNAKLILTEGSLGMKGSIAKAEELVEENNYVMLQQFDNESNAKAHYLTTAVELLNDIEKIDAFVAGVGTGGTITGVGKKLKEENEAVLIVAVEPTQSAVLSGNSPAPHKIQGIGAGFVPKVLDVNIYDEIIQIDGLKAMKFAKEIYLKEGLFLGISSAANIMAALQIAKKIGTDKTVVTIAPDGGEKYISNEVFIYGN